MQLFLRQSPPRVLHGDLRVQLLIKNSRLYLHHVHWLKIFHPESKLHTNSSLSRTVNTTDSHTARASLFLLNCPTRLSIESYNIVGSKFNLILKGMAFLTSLVKTEAAALFESHCPP